MWQITIASILLAGMPPSPGGWPYTLSPQSTGMLLDDVWPATFFGPERIPEMRRKIDTLPWARELYEQMLAEAELILALEPHQPIEPVGWRHDFYSRVSGEHLLWEEGSDWSFLDPLLGGRENGPKQHAAWVLLTHEMTHRRMRSLALLYALSGDERYAEWVAEGLRRARLMFAAGDELRYPARQDALYFQPLYDAVVFTQLAYAYQLTRDSAAYSAADHEAIRTEIFEAGMPSQLTFLDAMGVHNMTAYVSTAVAVSGQVFGRDDWVRRGLTESRTSLLQQLTVGVPDDDGLWYEGTMFYHYYSACPLITQFELDRTLDGPNHGDPRVQTRLAAMLEAPYRLADQAGRLPTIGDLGSPRHMKLALYRHLYEYAAGQLDYERFAPILASLYSAEVPRASLTALAYGPDTLPAAAHPQGHDQLTGPGLAIFRGADDRYLLFRGGPNPAGHDHPDRLGLDLRAFGQLLAVDPGTAGYALAAIHPYYRSTFSHNTLFVDETNQKGNLQQAEYRADLTANPPWAASTLRDAYEGVTMTRTVWFDEPRIVVLDELASDDEHRYGWILHGNGPLTLQMPAAEGPELPPLGLLERYLTGAQRGWSSGPLQASWDVDGVTLHLRTGADGPFEATWGRTPHNPMALDRQTLVLRAVGTTRRYWSVLEPVRGGGAPSATAGRLTPTGVEVHIGGAWRGYEPSPSL